MDASGGPYDHAGCSVGSYVHGLVALEAAAAGEDVAALVANEWVTLAELAMAPTLGWRPGGILYEPLAEAESSDVVLLRLAPVSLMTLQGAVPDLSLVGKPQCQIVALAAAGKVLVSPGCAVLRVRTRLPAGELVAGLPAGQLEDIVGHPEVSAAADDTVARYAARGTASRA